MSATAFIVSTGVVGISEIGDKTQLLALVLAARLRRPLPIVLGILVATLANHALAGVVGGAVAQWLGPDALRWVVGAGFIAVAAWMLVPDDTPAFDGVQPRVRTGWGVFVTTTLAFFVAEMGDKTQLATVALAARYDALAAVVAGTTLGMMLANVPAVLLGDRAANALPLRLVHAVSAALFLLLGVLTLAAAGPLL